MITVHLLKILGASFLISQTVSFANIEPQTSEQSLLGPSVQIYFATNRHFSKNQFTDEMAHKIHLGAADIQVPVEHKRGHLERPKGYRGGFVENPRKHFTINSLQVFNSSKSSHLKTLDLKEPKTAFVFIHGFKYSFERSLYRTAQIFHDMNYKGTPFAFSWPSQNSVGHYFEDKTYAQMSSEPLIEFLNLLQAQGYEKINILAHSMGNLTFGLAIDEIVNKQNSLAQKNLFDQVILAAPDISIEEFEVFFSQSLPHLSQRVTIYGSTDDRALKTAVRLNGQSRLGLFDHRDGPYIYSGFDYVDATDIEEDLVFSMHHTYFGRARVIDDLKALFEKNDSPKNRGLTAVPLRGNRLHWRIFNESTLALNNTNNPSL